MSKVTALINFDKETLEKLDNHIKTLLCSRSAFVNDAINKKLDDMQAPSTDIQKLKKFVQRLP